MEAATTRDNNSLQMINLECLKQKFKYTHLMHWYHLNLWRKFIIYAVFLDFLQSIFPQNKTILFQAWPTSREAERECLIAKLRNTQITRPSVSSCE